MRAEPPRTVQLGLPPVAQRPLPPAAAPVLILAPLGRDAELAAAILREAAIATLPCVDADALLAGLQESSGAALVTEEALDPTTLDRLARWVKAQPPWSDLPFVVLLRPGPGEDRGRQATRYGEALGNVALLERPLHASTLASVARTALASRWRQHEAREAIAAREATAARLQFALQAGHLGSWEAAGDPIALTCSDACRALFGRAPGADFSYADLFDAIHPADQPRMAAAVETAMREGGEYAIEYRVVWPDRSVHWAEVRGRATPGPDGRMRMVGVSLDITERRQAEEELRAHRERLEELVAARTAELADTNRRLIEAAEERDRAQAALLQAQKMEAVGQLTGGIAHDFNNLLQAVLASLDLIRRRANDPRAVERLALAGADAARRGAKLTAQLLAFSRHQRLTLTPVDLAALLEGMRDLLGRSLGPGVDIRLDPQENCRAMADVTQLELALLNLAINARDAMPEGGVLRIAVDCPRVYDEPGLTPGRYCAIRVTDTGVGMTPEVASRAFDPFFTTKEVGHGTGLGLAQVFGIARQSGGLARIESAPGRGTTVTLLLPEADGQPEAAAPPVVLPPRQAVGGGGALVLLVDDDAAVRRSCAEWLDALGYRVSAVADGFAALDALERIAPELVLADYAMPGMTGAELATLVRARRPGLPVVLATGHADERALRAAAGDRLPVLRKPFGMEDLADALAQALATTGDRPAAPR